MCYAVLAVVSNCCPPLKGRFLTRYSPVRHCPLFQLDESSFHRFSFDLHVLSTPPAFVLSQDQTLYKLYQHDVSIELIFTELFRSVYKELHADHETGLLTTKQAEYQAPGKCEIFSLFCCPGFPKGHPLAHDFACKV